MTWDGKERRKYMTHSSVSEKLARTAEDVVEIKGNLKLLDARINGSLDKMSSFMESGIWWRRTIIGIVITIILQATGGFVVATNLASGYGQNVRQIQVNKAEVETLKHNIPPGWFLEKVNNIEKKVDVLTGERK